ncbi:acyl-CoA dehydrogenase family protein [Microbacterium sp. No. 7]|uniref:acyl-CoA dehydrogenase family protein n=1 Tax=Microbacterium sp. No. 7 TaxID=1714373 RepID=UPI0006D065D5|nr:acyl-CoA dehydrogenase family protein [Microbacterium sp. No. 7]ALJ21894.1 acyl-CoA dehydrogenase [Microbacterium sp. No. 7]
MSRDLRPSARGAELRDRMIDFMHEHVFPAEHSYEQYRREAGPLDHTVPPVVEELKREARRRGLWNLFHPESEIGQLDYAHIAEISGWSLHLAPEAINGQAPDTGNMELLHLFGTPEQRTQWLEPLLDGTIRSGFAMTEPAVASSDATNIQTRIERDGDDYVITGRKWWTSGAADPRCTVLIVMGRTDPDAETHRQQSMVLVPMDTPGVTVVRDVPIFGRHDQHGHCEISFDGVRVPRTSLLGEEGGGFAAAQARLGPGRIHHCMRALGAGERALSMLVERAKSRVAFGGPLADQGVVQQQIAESRIELDQARLICHLAAKTIDEEGNKAAARLVSTAKVAVPRAVTAIIDRAIQVHGGAGVSDDTPLAGMWAWHRAMRLFDGPDEVHLRSIARAELRREPELRP